MTPIPEGGFLDRAVEKVFQGARWKTSAGPYPEQAFFIPQTSAEFVSSRCFTADGKRLQVPYPERAFSVRKHLPTSSSHHAHSIPRPVGKRLQGFRIPSEILHPANICHFLFATALAIHGQMELLPGRVSHARPLVDRQNIQARGPAQWLACARGRKLAHTAPVGGPWGDLAPPMGYSIFKERCSVLRRSTSGRTLIRFAHGTYQYAFWLCSLDFEVLRWDCCTSC